MLFLFRSNEIKFIGLYDLASVHLLRWLVGGLSGCNCLTFITEICNSFELVSVGMQSCADIWTSSEFRMVGILLLQYCSHQYWMGSINLLSFNTATSEIFFTEKISGAVIQTRFTYYYFT